MSRQIDNSAEDAAREAVCGSEVSAKTSGETTMGAKERMIAELLSLVQGWMTGKDSYVIDKIEVSPDKISVSFKSKVPGGNDASMRSSSKDGMSSDTVEYNRSQNSDPKPVVVSSTRADFISEEQERKLGPITMMEMRSNRAYRDQIVGQMRNSGYSQKEIDRIMGISQFDVEEGERSDIVNRIVGLMKDRDCHEMIIWRFVDMSNKFGEKHDKKEFTRDLVICMMWVCGCSQGQIGKIFRMSQPWVSRILSSKKELIDGELRTLWCSMVGLKSESDVNAEQKLD